jgi:hypothetical protein
MIIHLMLLLGANALAGIQGFLVSSHIDDGVHDRGGNAQRQQFKVDRRDLRELNS